MIEIKVNGETRMTDEGVTLAGLIADLGLDPKTVAALVNDEIVERERFDATGVKAGDTVELVRFVPGG
ncbi:MAG TPA: sulfur carrier protein ThiS [Candidatus Hydrogenedentes bacterium]|nr:sulfur carrier protein ThiS [Candidatus Hydrogenedentota bacterium]